MERVRIGFLSTRTWLIFCLLVLLTGCYHLRLVPAPLEKARLVTTKQDREALDAIASVLRGDGFDIQYLRGESGVVTGVRKFYTENGPGQPVEGRHYFYRLRVEILPKKPATEIFLEPFALEIESNYVYDSDGSLKSTMKRYPYEAYPGMFELSFVSQEVERVKDILERNL